MAPKNEMSQQDMIGHYCLMFQKPLHAKYNLCDLFLISILDNFQPETIHCSRRMGPSGVNRWSREFFQSAGTCTWTGEHTQLSLGQALWDREPNHLANPPGFIFYFLPKHGRKPKSFQFKV